MVHCLARGATDGATIGDGPRRIPTAPPRERTAQKPAQRHTDTKHVAVPETKVPYLSKRVQVAGGNPFRPALVGDRAASANSPRIDTGMGSWRCGALPVTNRSPRPSRLRQAPSAFAQSSASTAVWPPNAAWWLLYFGFLTSARRSRMAPSNFAIPRALGPHLRASWSRRLTAPYRFGSTSRNRT